MTATNAAGQLVLIGAALPWPGLFWRAHGRIRGFYWPAEASRASTWQRSPPRRVTSAALSRPKAAPRGHLDATQRARRPLAGPGQSLFGPALPRLVWLMSLLRVARPFASLISESCYLRSYVSGRTAASYSAGQLGKSALLEAHPLHSLFSPPAWPRYRCCAATLLYSVPRCLQGIRLSHLTRITSSPFFPISRPARQRANLKLVWHRLPDKLP